MKGNNGGESQANREQQKKKPPFRPAKDDTKPFLQDPVYSLQLLVCLFLSFFSSMS